MKLSANGIEKIHHNCRRMTYIIAGESGKPGDYTQYEGLDGADELEFESDDFTGAVILTAEEAKAIAYKLGYLGALTTQSKTEKETLELTDMLWWRIEQAEMSIASTQCENVSKKDEKIITLTVEQAEGK